MSFILLSICDNSCVILDSTKTPCIAVVNDCVISRTADQALPFAEASILGDIAIFRMVLGKYKVKFESIEKLDIVKPSNLLDLIRNIDRVFTYRWSVSSQEHEEWCLNMCLDLEEGTDEEIAENTAKHRRVSSELLPHFQPKESFEEERVRSFIDIVAYHTHKFNDSVFKTVIDTVKNSFVSRLSEQHTMRFNILTIMNIGSNLSVTEAATSIPIMDIVLRKKEFEFDKALLGSADVLVNVRNVRFISSHRFFTVNPTMNGNIVLSVSPKIVVVPEYKSYDCIFLAKHSQSVVTYDC